MKAVCPGSYDPVTTGHIDVFARAARLVDELVVAVVHNPSKTGNFPIEKRIALIEDALAADPRTAEATNITIEDVPGGLLVDYCSRIGAAAVIKGVRSGADYAYELPMALMNRHLTELETIFIPGDPRFEHVSSSLIREVHSLGGDISELVPAGVLAALDEKRSQG